MLTRAPQMNNYSFYEFEVYGPTLTGAAEIIEETSDAPLLDTQETGIQEPSP